LVSANDFDPEQVHISLGVEESSYVVTWVTQDMTNKTMVLYGLDSSKLGSVESGYQTVFTDGGPLRRQIYIHRVTLNSLPSDEVIYYQVGGDSNGWSEKVFKFRTLPLGSDWSARLIVYGDLGLQDAEALPLLIDETSKGNVHLILHVGDFAYNMEDDDARVGDEFMRQLEPVASTVPYMTSPGNHESAYNFSNYRNRFTMPGGDGEGFFYSFNVGRAHFIAFTPDFYYYTQYGVHQIRHQFEWLENDLMTATRPSNRKERPWIIAFGHRPMYCSNLKNTQHCLNVHNYARVGIPHKGKYYYGLEQLFYKYGVDLIFNGHEHSYERMWPVYDLTVRHSSVF
jgi:acid phosphatase type 7